MPATTSERKHEPIEIGDTLIQVGKNRFDVTTPEGRMAARALAWTVAADGELWLRDVILRKVGRDDG